MTHKRQNHPKKLEYSKMSQITEKFTLRKPSHKEINIRMNE